MRRPTPAQFRKLHAVLQDLGITREEFKRKTGCLSMLEWDRGTMNKRIRFASWIGKQPYPVRRRYGARR